MKSFLKRLEQNLVEKSSRRSFISKVGSVVAALAAFTTGQALWSKNAAHAEDTPYLLHCCDGSACNVINVCPANTTPLYTWNCLDNHDHQNYICTDCFKMIETKPNKVYRYFCTFASHVSTNQTAQAATSTSMSCQSSKADIVLE